MDMQVVKVDGQPGVALIDIQGDLDASNYESLIAIASELHKGGFQHLVLNLTGVKYVSSSGLVALHRSLLVMNGVPLQDEMDGWGAMHAVAEEKRPLQKRVSLIGLQPRVESTLDMAGMKDFFDIFADVKTALAAAGNIQRA